MRYNINNIYKNAEDAALNDGFDQVIAKNTQGKIFFTRLMGNITCSCITNSDKILGCITVIPAGGIKKAQFIRA